MSISLDKRILGYLMSEKSTTLKVIDTVPDAYLDPQYREFFKLIKRCVKRYRETPTIRMAQEDTDWTEDYSEVYTEACSYKNREDYNITDFSLDLDSIKDRHNSEVLLRVGRDIYKDNYNGKGFEDINEANRLLRKAVADIDRIRVSRIYKEGSLRNTADDADERYQQIKANPDMAKGIHVGMREFDRITNGLQSSELVLIGGESSAGKSALAMNMAINAWRGSNQYPEDPGWVEASEYAQDGSNVMYFTIEMPFDPFRRRIDSCLGGVPLYGIRDGSLTGDEEIRYKSALEFQKKYDKEFHIIDIPRGCTVSQIESKYMELLYEFTPELVVVDYISLMKIESEGEGQDWLNIGKLAEMLHEFCRTYAIPCITPVQLTRPKPGTGNLPDQHRVGRSIMLPQNCNIMLNIDVRPDETTKPDMVVNIAKMRDGEKGAFTLHKRLDIMRIYDDVPGWTPEIYEVNNGEEGSVS